MNDPQLRKEAAKEGEPFLFDPKFDVRYDDSSRRLSLIGGVIDYHAVGTLPPEGHSDAVAQYRLLTDWSARLNATHKQSFPPFARMELNRELFERGLLPEEVELQYTPRSKPGQKAVYRSRQVFAWALTETDRRLILDANRQLLEFPPIDFREYRKNRP
jgi:hypothetical protein